MPAGLSDLPPRRGGEGTTTIVREFASFLVSTFDATVLIVDANLDGARAKLSDAGAAPLPELVRVLSMDGGPETKRRRVSITLLPRDMFNLPAARDGAAKIADIAQLRAHFDYILVDLPAFAIRPAAVSIGRQIDGIVIVIEAERAPWSEVEITKRAYEAVGANILGAVINKRRFYLPRLIYTRL